MAVRDAAARPGTYPLIVFSHPSGGHRRTATFLCTHLSSHGYVVAALDHSEVVAVELARRDGETDEQKTARADAWIGNRVPDIRFLIDHLLNGAAWNADITLDSTQIGIAGHSFGGWTALAAPDVERRIRAVVALAPGGSSRPKPGILRASLAFSWDRDVPTLYLVAENDISLPLTGMFELFERTPATKQMVILRRADHLHFMDNVEEVHETVRTMKFTGELAWISKEMRPIAELCSGEQAHLFVRGLTLCHMDAILRRHEEAQRFLVGDVEAELAVRGVDAIAHKP
jgi:predicted dienelactone hydrolase